MLSPSIISPFGRLDHLPLQIRSIVNARRHMASLVDCTNILGRRPLVDEFLAVLDRLALFS